MTDAGSVLFDLDGTLTDPFIGITSSMQHALRQMGQEPPLAEELRRYIGPPLQATFMEMLGDEALAAQALGFYRARYGEVGKFENELIPGIVEAVQTLSDSGYRLFVATSKLETYSIDIIDHFGLAPFFRRVHGSALDGSRADKGELIRHILQAEGLDPRRTVMIGDRLHDVHGAARTMSGRSACSGALATGPNWKGRAPPGSPRARPSCRIWSVGMIGQLGTARRELLSP